MDMQKLLVAFANSIPDPVVITGTDHTVLFVNSAAVDLFKEDESLVGKSRFSCHKDESNHKIEQVPRIFMKPRPIDEQFDQKFSDKYAKYDPVERYQKWPNRRHHRLASLQTQSDGVDHA